MGYISPDPMSNIKQNTSSSGFLCCSGVTSVSLISFSYSSFVCVWVIKRSVWQSVDHHIRLINKTILWVSNHWNWSLSLFVDGDRVKQKSSELIQETSYRWTATMSWRNKAVILIFEGLERRRITRNKIENKCMKFSNLLKENYI